MFKHALLSRYTPKFGGITGSKSGGEVVYLAGYAGEGRYGNGEPGSADTVLRIAADHQAKRRQQHGRQREVWRAGELARVVTKCEEHRGPAWRAVARFR
ncbi:hypothetical protein GCM10009665_41660 [Kitasatospora nipponensis]|uniref:Uncharacterized protein n=1 Tax=Kitasatospora nipponensis TaxID=258049 RepID=A0ABN1WDV0_9ACTN